MRWILVWCTTGCNGAVSMKFFRLSKFFLGSRAVPKIGSIQFLGTLTGRGVSRVNYEVPRLSKLHEDARRCSKDFQQVWYELEMFKVCRDDMPCEVKKNPLGVFWQRNEWMNEWILALFLSVLLHITLKFSFTTLLSRSLKTFPRIASRRTLLPDQGTVKLLTTLGPVT